MYVIDEQMAIKVWFYVLIMRDSVALLFLLVSMQLLLSMTGATPETRLVLLTWAVRLGRDFQSGSMDALAKALGVSKRKLGIALQYLEKEGYLWKIRSPLERQKDDKSKLRFDYALSTECIRMWRECLETCSWQDELESVLRVESLAETSSAVTSATLHVNEGLVWVILLMHANKARYVIGCDDSLLCKIAGITQLTLRRALKALVNKGLVSVAADGVKRSELFPYLPPIYKIYGQQPDTKILKLGLPLVSTDFFPLRCVSKLAEHYKKTQKLANGRYPRQDSMLSDEQYFQLSEFFSSKELVSWVNHLHLSTITSLVPTVEYYDKENREECEAKLRSAIMTIFLHELRDIQFSTPQAELADSGNDEFSKTSVINRLNKYIIDALIKESLYGVLEISRYWRLLVECMGRDGRIIDYNQRERMVVIGHQQLKVEASGEREEKETTVLVNHFVPFVLTVITPERDSYDHCLVLKDHLLMSNTKIEHAKIDHVQYLICGTDPHKLAGILRNLTSDQVRS
ncbi:hypothetical protein [Shewanella algae]|uniref:hypothetical protein n=1 Tax=Shewanella algae TaxID=38313 RepID=UPI0031F5306D